MTPSLVAAASTSLLAYHRLALLPLPLACSFVAPISYRHRLQIGSRECSARCSSSSNNMADGNMGLVVETRYRITAPSTKAKWVDISFDAANNTTLMPRADCPHQNATADASCSSQQSSTQGVPESVLQYQRQMRKIQAADRASKTNINVDDHLHTIYFDDHVVVADKPSGILCVPGVNKYRSLLDLVYDVYGSKDADADATDDKGQASDGHLPRDSMIVHRLDMDTSGVVIFARTRSAMSELHASFREKAGTEKAYEALLVGWLDAERWAERADTTETEDSARIGEAAITDDATNLGGGEINLPLQRDHRHPPFMRVSTPESEAAARAAVKDLNHNGYKKLIAKKPKASTTRFRVLSHETWKGHPVTRVELTPVTGRTHQLRVHCAALGHPILGDPAYGYCGEAHPNGGISDDVIRRMSPTCASMELRKAVEQSVQESGRTMCLHARKLTLDHPVTKERVSFEAAPSF